MYKLIGVNTHFNLAAILRRMKVSAFASTKKASAGIFTRQVKKNYVSKNSKGFNVIFNY